MSTRRWIIGAHDLAMTAVALEISFLLRWGSAEFRPRLEPIALTCLLTLPVALAAYRAFRLNQAPWKYVSIADLNRIALAVTLPALFLVLVDFLSRGALVVPRTVPVIYWLLQIFLLAGPRVAYRLYRSRRQERRALRGARRAPVIIAGADDEADELIARIRRDPVSPLEPVALLTAKRKHLGERIRQVPILGGIDELEIVLRKLEIRRLRPTRLIVTRETLRSPDIDALLGTARRLGLTTVRPSGELTRIGSADQPLALAPVSIDDLLGREARDLDLGPARDLVSGRLCAVTGAGGSIGSELCRQLAGLGASGVLLFDISELALSTISRELGARHPALPLTIRLGDVSDRQDVGRAFRAFRPNLVFHAAALKHVDLVEGHPVAAARTNLLGTAEVADAARDVDAICAVFISTDKAVDPVSVLGATKRAGEFVWAAQDRGPRRDGRATRFVTVRFGNVLGSSGSVIPLFTEQLRQGGPITVTHPDVERYFMTITEAVRLVLMASAIGVRSDEASPTFVLDMGEPIRIVDLARRMIRLAGLEPEVDVAITFSGLRSGERLAEALSAPGEELRPTVVPGIRATASPIRAAAMLERQIGGIRSAVERHDPDEVARALRDLVPDYRPVAPTPAAVTAETAAAIARE